MVARALRAAGLRVGRYTSPHLVHLHERFAIDDVDVADAALDGALQAVFDAEDALLARGALAGPATYFELTTAAAFVIFRDARVQVAVIEVGLGGRHDATNVVAAPYAAITSIGLDHTAQLGGTLAEIAREKAGVIAPGAIVVSGVVERRACRGHRRTSARRRAPDLVRADEDTEVDVDHARRGDDDTAADAVSRLRPGAPRAARRSPGRQRRRRRAPARGAGVRRYRRRGEGDHDGPRRCVLARTARTADVRRTASPLVLDGAHNPAGAEALADGCATRDSRR